MIIKIEKKSNERIFDKNVQKIYDNFKSYEKN